MPRARCTTSGPSEGESAARHPRRRVHGRRWKTRLHLGRDCFQGSEEWSPGSRRGSQALRNALAQGRRGRFTDPIPRTLGLGCLQTIHEAGSRVCGLRYCQDCRRTKGDDRATVITTCSVSSMGMQPGPSGRSVSALALSISVTRVCLSPKRMTFEQRRRPLRISVAFFVCISAKLHVGLVQSCFHVFTILFVLY
jgi:hypothetical protein